MLIFFQSRSRSSVRYFYFSNQGPGVQSDVNIFPIWASESCPKFHSTSRPLNSVPFFVHSSPRGHCTEFCSFYLFQHWLVFSIANILRLLLWVFFITLLVCTFFFILGELFHIILFLLAPPIFLNLKNWRYNIDLILRSKIQSHRGGKFCAMWFSMLNRGFTVVCCFLFHFIICVSRYGGVCFWFFSFNLLS